MSQTLYFGGPIVTMERELYVQALLTEGERILYAGSLHGAEERAEGTVRRVDLKVTAAYDAPVEGVKAAIQAVIARHEKILGDPAPFARLSGYGDSALEYTVRVWCQNQDYWTVYHDLLEGIKTAFDEQGISIPYPQMEVTLRK